MTPSSRKHVLIAVLVAALAAAVGWWFGRQPGADDAVAPRASADAAMQPVASVEAPVAEPAEPAVASAQPVTPEVRESLAKRPLLEQFDALAASARSGDVDLACRLGSGLLRCFEQVDAAATRRSPADEAEWIAQARPENQERIIEALAEHDERLRRMDDHCRGVSRTAHQRAALEMLLIAARGGNSVARHEFVAMHLATVDLVRDPALARLYGENAPGVFRAMWDEGDPRAIDLLERFAGGPQLSVQAGTHAIPLELRDDGLARALRDEQARHLLDFERTHPSREAPIDPAQRAAAQRIWNERFEHSAHVAARREQRAQRRGQPAVQTLDPVNPCDEEAAPVR